MASLNQKYGCDLNPLWLKQYVFELSGLKRRDADAVERISGNDYAPVNVVHTRQNNRFLIKFNDSKFDPDRNISTMLTTDISAELSEFLGEGLKFLTEDKIVIWKCGDKILKLGANPVIMGIVNVTPDSFSDGGRFSDRDRAVEHALALVEQGAEIIDIGGESTRPGAEKVNTQEEMDRVIPVIEQVRRHTDVFISIDTYKSSVADAALKSGADIVNDISAATFDPQMTGVVRAHRCPLIIMHIQGTPRNMQKDPCYEDAVAEIYFYLQERIAKLEAAGITDIAIDPGIGFGKRLIDNLQILRDLQEFKFLNKPLLVGSSRKSFLGRILNKEVDQRLSGSLAAQARAIESGADILRVHDVEETNDLKKVLQAIAGAD